MAITNKGSKWEIKNSLFVLFGFIPFLNCLAFFHMSSRVKNRKWSLLGWIAIILNVFLLIVSLYTFGADNPNEYPHYEINAPQAVDYMNKEQKAKALKDGSYEYSVEFKLSDEYEKYQKDYDKWSDDYHKWEKTPEIASMYDKYNEFTQRALIISDGALVLLLVLNIILLVIVLTDRPKYLKLLEQSENRSGVVNRMDSVRKNAFEETDNPKKSVDIKQIDINSATEDELSSLQGLTIIDAKKIIAYRDEHNGFDNIDEFFTCINAKPHIVVGLEKQLIVGEYKAVKAAKTDNPGKRMLDL